MLAVRVQTEGCAEMATMSANAADLQSEDVGSQEDFSNVSDSQSEDSGSQEDFCEYSREELMSQRR